MLVSDFLSLNNSQREILDLRFANRELIVYLQYEKA
jgi:hypothetical protein